MNTKIKILYMLMVSILLVSCDNYLDIKPKGELIAETATDYEQLLNHYGILKTSAGYPSYLTDDVYIPDNRSSNGFVGFDAIIYEGEKNLYSFASAGFGSGEDDQLWLGSYKNIATYNVIVENILDATQASLEEKQSIRAEALVGRSLEYLNLVNAYGKHYDEATAASDLGVPIVTSLDIENNAISRASVKAVYEQIENDLKEALKYLPEKPKSNAYRASKNAALGVLARMYLYMGNYEKALESANEILKTYNYLHDLKSDKVKSWQMWMGRLTVPDIQFNEENIYNKTPPYVFGLSGSVMVSEDLVSVYDTLNDQRCLLYFVHNAPKSSYLSRIGDNYFFLTGNYVNFGIATPEIYLTAAECEARIGSKDRAMELINTLRDNRILNNTPLTAASNDEALVQVLNERRRELPFLGLSRLIDLKRLNKDARFAKDVVHVIEGEPHVLKAGSPLYVLPIPEVVLKNNPNMKDNVR